MRYLATCARRDTRVNGHAQRTTHGWRRHTNTETQTLATTPTETLKDAGEGGGGEGDGTHVFFRKEQKSDSLGSSSGLDTESSSEKS
jgi:hypothetical protein